MNKPSKLPYDIRILHDQNNEGAHIQINQWGSLKVPDGASHRIY